LEAGRSLVWLGRPEDSVIGPECISFRRLEEAWSMVVVLEDSDKDRRPEHGCRGWT
jgi:hypothetical protein